MEWNDPPDGRRVSSFDQLFRTAARPASWTPCSPPPATGATTPAQDGPLSGAAVAGRRGVPGAVGRAQPVAAAVGAGIGGRRRRLGAGAGVRQDLRRRPVHRPVPGPVEHARHPGPRGGGVARPRGRRAATPTAGRSSSTTGRPAALDRARTARTLEMVLQALVEHYDEYRDYNTTTTQSDYGENLHILLDFLRLKVALRPLRLADAAAGAGPRGAVPAGVRRAGGEVAGVHRRQDAAGSPTNCSTSWRTREAEYGIRLRTVRDRLEERFVHAAGDRPGGGPGGPGGGRRRGTGRAEDNPAFAGLLAAIGPLADHVSGVGLDVPAWVRRLEDALRQTHDGPPGEHGRRGGILPLRGLDFAELRRQTRATGTSRRGASKVHVSRDAEALRGRAHTVAIAQEPHPRPLPNGEGGRSAARVGLPSCSPSPLRGGGRGVGFLPALRRREKPPRRG